MTKKILLCEIDEDTGYLLGGSPIDAVPVVRCRDCKWHMNWDGELTCGLHDGFYETGSEWFCADGERRDNEDTKTNQH